MSGNMISCRINPTDSESTVDAGKPKTVYIRKNWYPIFIIQLAKVLEIAWKMKEGFDLLTSSVGSLSDGHSVSYMINIVENFTPMYTYYAFQHAENQMITVMDRTLGATEN